MELVKHGIRWSVGDGKKIKLLTEIPNIAPGSFKTLTPVPSGVTVDFLLLEGHSSWDAVIVRSVFEEEVANQVLQIPVSFLVGEDFVSWPFTKFGAYIVRSGSPNLEPTLFVLVTTWQEQRSSILNVANRAVESALKLNRMPSFGRNFGLSELWGK
jgi:hypothetical protein